MSSQPSFCNSPLIKVTNKDETSNQVVPSPCFGSNSHLRQDSARETKSQKERRNRSSRIKLRNSQGDITPKSDEQSKDYLEVSPERRILVRQSYSRTASLEDLLKHSPNKNEIVGFARHNAAKKIQRVFRVFLLWKRVKQKAQESRQNNQYAKLRKILAAKVIVKNIKRWLLALRGKRERKYKIRCIIKIQRHFRKHLKNKKMKFLSQHLLAFFEGWKVRRSITILEQKVKEYVHEDNEEKRRQLKENFHLLYDKIMKDKLYIIARYKKYTEQLKKTTQSDHKRFNKTPVKQQSYVISKQDSHRQIHSQAKNDRVRMFTDVKLNQRSPASQRNRPKNSQPLHKSIKSLKQPLDPQYFQEGTSDDSTKHMEKSTTAYNSNQSEKVQKTIKRSISPLVTNNKVVVKHEMMMSRTPQRNSSRPKLNSNQTTRDNTQILSTSRLSQRSASKLSTSNLQKPQQQYLPNDEAIQDLLKFREQYRNNFRQMEQMLDQLVDDHIQQLQQQQGKPKIQIAQVTKDNMKYNRLHSDVKDVYDRLSHAKYYNYKPQQ